MRWQVIQGDCIEGLKTLPDSGVHCCVTSPPYFGLRDYGHQEQIGLESTPNEYVERLVSVFREVRRVLRDDGTLWLNLGDSYARTGGWSSNDGLDNCARGKSGRAKSNMQTGRNGQKRPTGLKEKDLIGIPWRVAFALQSDEWYLRQDIIWHKPNPMPESVTDRCTKAHEYVFLLSKSERYFYDHEQIAEPGVSLNGEQANRNRRSVWTINPQSCGAAHFAVMPEALAELCVRAGCPEGGVVFDPFTGSGTTGIVSLRHQRHFIGTELNADYCEMARRRIASSMPLYAVEGSVQ